jgi:translocation and assembly module TamA
MLLLALLASGCASQRAWLGAHLLPGGDAPATGTDVAGERADDGDASAGPFAEVVLEGIERDAILPSPVPLPCDAPPWRAERAEAEWREAIALARRRAGDYTPTINARIRAPRTSAATAPAAADKATEAPPADAGTAAAPCWRLRFQVTEGRNALVRELRVALHDSDDAALRDIVDSQPLRIGEPFLESRYESFKSALSRQAEETGYFDARFTEHRVDIYPEDAVADVALVFAPGTRYAFGDLRIDAPDVPLRPALIERMAPFRAGEPYVASSVDLLRSRLTESGYFASVDVHPEPGAASDGRVPIAAALTPLPRLAVTAGAGFATDIGPRGQLAYENRFVNDRGHQASATLKVSPVVSEAALGYRIPSNRPAERWWTVDAGGRRERTDETESDTATIGVRHVRLQSSGWRRTFALDLAHERFEVGDDRGSSLLLVPSARLERSVAHAGAGPLDTGWRVAAVLSGTHEQLLSDVSFLQLLLEGRYAFALGTQSRVLARLEGGTTWVAGFAELPPSYRLFAGGDDSVRGYDFKSLGPPDNQNEVRGGRHRISASLEYERLFAPTWSWAVFADSGNAFDDLPVGMRTGVGLGLRWHSPVGSVRIDLAHPLTDSDQQVRIHIGIGRVQ